ncbi:hypothetical protein ACHAXR_007244 [Thalassiosira sp. AJA248-18]
MTAPLPALALALSLPLFSHGFSFQSSPLAHMKPSLPSALSSTSTAYDATTSSNIADDASTNFWKWRGHDIFTEMRSATTSQQNDGDDDEDSTKKPAVILLHGFGASTTYWRETMSVLQSEGYDVHALDLLGQGRSSKPLPSKPFEGLYSADEGVSDTNSEVSVMKMGENTDTKVEYSIDLWANLVDDYARHHQLDEIVLMGNSLGSLVALSAATGDFIDSNTNRESVSTYLAGNNNVGETSRVKGVCLFNCAVGLNSQNVIKNPSFNSVQRAALGWLFGALNNLIFDNEFLLTYALNNIVTKELLADALKSLYIVSPDRVDEELVDSFYYPAKLGGDGAVEAIRQIYCNDAGLTPLEYHKKYPEILDSMPLHLIWGLEDVVTPIQGDVGLFYCDRVANNRGGKSMTTIDCVKSGHMPFDDNPVETHNAMMKWLNKKIVKK